MTTTGELLVLGDSHTPVFGHPLFGQAFPHLRLNVVTVIGATASGLENPNTRTRAYPIFKAAAAVSKARKALVMLGEVDTGFVIWYRAQKYGEPVAAMMDRAVTSYGKFLLELADRFEVICISTPLPTIVDGNDWGEVANMRKEVTATLAERTALTLDFNLRMRDFCARHGIRHLLLDTDSLGEDGLIKPSLRNADPANHHYDPDAYARLLVDHLTGAL